MFEYDYYTVTDDVVKNNTVEAGTIKSATLIPYTNFISNELSTNGQYKIVNAGNATLDSLSGVYPLTPTNGTVSFNKSDTPTSGIACLTLNAAVDAVTSLPIYIEKMENGKMVGMLKQVLTTPDDETTTDKDEKEYTAYPRYGYILYEDLSNNTHWQLKSMEHDGTTDTSGTGADLANAYIHPIEFNSSTLTFTNTYDLKDILLTKNVTNAPADISDYAFVFRLKRNNADITSNEANNIKWELCDYVNKKAVSMNEPVTGSVEWVNETESGKYDYCTFIVPMCGNDKTSDAVKTIQITGIPADSAHTYTIEEVLKADEQNAVSENQITLGNVWVEANSNGTAPKEYSYSDTGVIQIGEKYYKQVYYTTVSGYTDDTGETTCEYAVLGTYDSTTQSVIPSYSAEKTDAFTKSMYIKDGENYVLRYYIPREGNAVHVKDYVEAYTISLNPTNGTSTMSSTTSAVTKTYKLAQDTMFNNSVKAGSKKITLDSSAVSMKVENDYLMRSIMVQKTVAGNVNNNPDFTMYIVREDGQKSDFITGNTVKYTVDKTEKTANVVTLRYANEENGSIVNEVQAIELKLKADETAIFQDIDLKGTSYVLYEEVNHDCPPLFDGQEGRIYKAESDTATTGTVELAGSMALRMKLLSDSPNEVLNGDSDFIMIGKLYTGQAGKGYDKPVTLKLSLGDATGIKVTDFTLTTSTYDSGKPIIANSSDPNTALTSGTITIQPTEKIVVNLKKLYEQLKNDGISSLPDSYDDLYFYATETAIGDTTITNEKNYITFPSGTSNIVIRSENENQRISGDINTHNVSLMNNISVFESNNVIYKRIVSSGTESASSVAPTTPLEFQITNAGDPVSGIGYVVAYIQNNTSTAYAAGISDADGKISIPYRSSWDDEKGVSSYKFALYFSADVAIKDSNYIITEIPNAEWGTLIGYESYADDIDNKVNKSVISAGTQWDERSDKTLNTFVNTLEKTEMEVYKTVNKPTAPSPADYTDGATDPDYLADLAAYNEEIEAIKSAVFTYDIKQLIDGTAVSASPDIDYDVYKTEPDGNGGYKRTGEKLNTETLHTINGQFTLKDGEMAVLKVAKYAQWQITEVQQGTYKLVTDNNGDIVNDEAFFKDNAADTKNAEIIGTGFKIGSDTGDINEPVPVVNIDWRTYYNGQPDSTPEGHPVIIRHYQGNGSTSPFALVEINDNDDDPVDLDDVTFTNYSNYDSYGSYAIRSDIDSSSARFATAIYSDPALTKLLWKQGGGNNQIVDYWITTDTNGKKVLTIPNFIYYKDASDSNTVKKHAVIAIGTKSATNTGNDSRFNEKNKFDKVVLSPENRYIGAEEFLKNNASTNPLSSIEFKSYPDGTGGVTHIGTSAFNACSQATDFDFPPNVVQINNMAYGWMGGISDLHFPLSLSYLTPKNFTKSDGTRASFGNWAFQYNNIDNFVCGIFTVDRTIFNVLDTNSNPVSGATADIFDIYDGIFGPNTIEFTNLVGTISGNTFKDSGKFNKVKFYILNDAVNVESGAWNGSNGSEAVLIIRGSNLNRIGYNCGFNQSTQTVILSDSNDKTTAQSIFGNSVTIKTQAEFKAEHPNVASIRTFVEDKSSGATVKSIERVIQVLCDDLEIEYTFDDETGLIVAPLSATTTQQPELANLFHPTTYIRKEDYLYSA